MNTDIQKVLLHELARNPNDNYLVIVSDEFMVRNYIWIQDMPKRCEFKTDNVAEEFGRQFAHVGTVRDGVMIINETQFKNDIRVMIYNGMVKEFIRQK